MFGGENGTETMKRVLEILCFPAAGLFIIAIAIPAGLFTGVMFLIEGIDKRLKLVRYG